MSIVVEVLAGGVRGGTSIMYAALGETVSERAGVINLGTEGSMLAGALAGYAVAVETGNPWARRARRGRARRRAARRGARAPGAQPRRQPVRHRARRAVPRPRPDLAVRRRRTWASDRPASRPADPAAVRDPVARARSCSTRTRWSTCPTSLAPALWWLIFRSRWGGLLLRAAGERTEVLTATATGSMPSSTPRSIVGGVLAGIGGAHLSIAYANAWFENMTAGPRLHRGRAGDLRRLAPVQVPAGAYLFGAALALSPALQARGYRRQPVRPGRRCRYLVTIARPGRARPRGPCSPRPEELRKVFDDTARTTPVVTRPPDRTPRAPHRDRPRAPATADQASTTAPLPMAGALDARGARRVADPRHAGLPRHDHGAAGDTAAGASARRPARQQGRRLHLRRPEGRLRLQPGRLRGQPGGGRGVPRPRRCSPPRTCPRTTTPPG